MKVVWIVIGIHAHGDDILGVFGTEEKAITCKAEAGSDSLENYVYITISRYEVE